MIKRFFELQERVLNYHKNANTELLKKAYSIAADAHLNQTRASKESYITHPLSVAAILADMKLDEISIASGLLHDVVEDSSYSIEDINRLFGKEIGDIVWGVTKITKISDMDAENAKAETLKKMIIAMTHDVRVILIKLADRMHNISTLGALKAEKRKRIAKETLDIYAPIAARLGMGKIKGILEDTSFKYSYPEEHERISSEIGNKKEWAQQKLELFQKELKKILKDFGIKGDIHYRIKREISIYRKLKRQNIDLNSVFDLLGLRIILNSIEDCYAIMGEIHQRYRPIPGRWRDFIANPRNNGYQSIHTTIISGEGIKYEIQIRTKEMHRVAEEGIAAHWKYKDGISFLENDNRLHWFREMIEIHKENPNPTDFLNLVKGDLTEKELYVFTPKGKVINLKAGSTPIDFAYAIHTEVGDHCKGAIVNEHMVPIKKQLSSGDVIEIQTSKNVSPSIDWLKHVATNKARKKILNFIQQKENKKNIEKGRRLWSKVLREYKKKYKLKLNSDEVLGRLNRLHYTDCETFYRDLGSNKKSLDKKTLRTIFSEVEVLEIKPKKTVTRKKDQLYKLISVEGYQNIDFVFAKCCNPVKGEKIRGYITLNRGLVIHRDNCSSLKNVISDRVKSVQWNDTAEFIQLVKYDLIVNDSPGILSQVSNITANHNSNIKKIENENITQNTSKIKITFEISDISQLKKIYKDFTDLKDVFQVIRKRISEK
ncbi:MAG: bifunctional (p)ppGpp synthetase/guanosine-3',5'-bis(diphosphate) 3'-pyrophosphohydrolase [Acidobacteriota bacterium]